MTVSKRTFQWLPLALNKKLWDKLEKSGKPFIEASIKFHNQEKI